MRGIFIFLIPILFSLKILLSCKTQKFEEIRPNIILITSLNHPLAACDPYKGLFSKFNVTPNLQKLSKEGKLFESCFTPSAIARPAMAAIYSGMHPHRSGTFDLYSKFPTDSQHLIIELNKSGYETAIFGHWHLDEEPVNFNAYKVTPIHHSFYKPPFHIKDEGVWPDNLKSFGEYVDIQSTNFAIDYLNQSETDNPFFMQLNFKASQELDSVLPEYIKEFEGLELPQPATLFNRSGWGSIATRGANDSLVHCIGSSYSGRHNYRQLIKDMKVEDVGNEHEAISKAYNMYVGRYLAAFKSVDNQIGRLISAMKEMGKYDNTIIIYTSYNGMMLGAHDLLDKRWMYEEAIGVPLIIYNPFAEEHTKIETNLVSLVDLTPTILSLVNSEIPGFMQGNDFSGAFTRAGIENPRQYIYYHYWMHLIHHDVPSHYGIRSEDKKLIYFYGEHYADSLNGTQSMFWLNESNLVRDTPKAWEFYDLKKDKIETTNRYGVDGYEQEISSLKYSLDSIRRIINLEE